MSEYTASTASLSEPAPNVDVASLLLRGRELLGMNDIDAAEVCAREALASSPASAAAAILLARIAVTRNEPAMALRLWKLARTARRGDRARQKVLSNAKLVRQRSQLIRTVRRERPLLPQEALPLEWAQILPLAEDLLRLKDLSQLRRLHSYLSHDTAGWSRVLSETIEAGIHFHSQSFRAASNHAVRALACLRAGIPEASASETIRLDLFLQEIDTRSRTTMGEPPEPLCRLEGMGKEAVLIADLADMNTAWRKEPGRGLKLASHLAFGIRPPRAAEVLFCLLPNELGRTSHAVRNVDILLMRYRDAREPLPPEIAFAVAAVDHQTGNRQASALMTNLAFRRFGLESPWAAEAESFEGLGASVDSMPDDGPLVSISMNAFNAASTVELALKSILSQTHRNLEVFFIDDCSSDETYDCAVKVAAGDPRVRFIRNSFNRGAYGSRNVALSRASGVYFTCMDADDWAHPRRIERHLAVMEAESDLICSSSNWIRMDEAGCPVVRRTTARYLHVNPGSPFFRLDEVRRRIGFYDEVRVDADMEFTNRLKAIYGLERFVRLRAPLTIGRYHASSLTRSGVGAQDDENYSEVRSLYRLSALKWRESLYESGDMFIDRNPISRSFAAPAEIVKGSGHQDKKTQ